MFYGLKYATHTLRYETLNADWSEFLRLAGLPNIPLPRHNVGEGRDGRHWRELYSPAARDLVAQAFANEITQLEYTF